MILNSAAKTKDDMKYTKGLMRLIEFSFAFLLLILFTPIFLITAICIRVESKGPIFFKQTRGGYKGKHFIIYKFRTMYHDIEKESEDRAVLPSDARVTKVGNILRKTSIDELPQILNILLGDMSFVGPRPTLASQTDNYNDYQKLRLEVKPGVTGLAQISGRNELTWDEKIKIDIDYIKRKSIRLDLYILLQTFYRVIKAEGVYRNPPQ
ncbi:sugar transferase [Planococcus shixiaomingii]|uniref:sugar transferase n=1 Tax=Planococcus shixiaomingii TaxID=3058393 RepID=UPI002613DB3D|nr:sugar transferase [Planococcus sp. N022]WKA53866.1 sugar transferase [Planococcus sp. N022]